MPSVRSHAVCGLFAIALPAAACDVGQPMPGTDAAAPDAGGATDAASDSAAPVTDAGPPCPWACAVDETVAGPFDFPNEVEPIFTSYCSFGACHIGTGVGGDEVLLTGTICSATVNVVAFETEFGSMMPRITPFDPEASYLFHKVRGTHLCAPAHGSGARMPFGYPCLTPTQLGTIRAWILEGAVCN